MVRHPSHGKALVGGAVGAGKHREDAAKSSPKGTMHLFFGKNPENLGPHFGRTASKKAW